MRKTDNKEKIKGRVFQHDLSIKTVKNQNSDNFGKNYIAGTLDVATDEEGLNVITIHYTYVTPSNNSYGVLEKIINGAPTWAKDGKENALKVDITTSLALNDFYSQRDSKFVSVKRNEGGFVSVINDLGEESLRAQFTFDMVITKVTRIEENPENQTPEYAKVQGAIFNFKKELLPIELVVKNPEGMNYFEDLGASSSNPVFTKVWGDISSTTIKIKTEVESAFGGPSVVVVTKDIKEWIITGTAKVPYEFGDESAITAEELTKAMQDRELKLAEIKKSSEEYQATKARSGNAIGNVVNTVAADFSF